MAYGVVNLLSWPYVTEFGVIDFGVDEDRQMHCLKLT